MGSCGALYQKSMAHVEWCATVFTALYDMRKLLEEGRVNLSPHSLASRRLNRWQSALDGLVYAMEQDEQLCSPQLLIGWLDAKAQSDGGCAVSSSSPQSYPQCHAPKHAKTLCISSRCA